MKKKLFLLSGALVLTTMLSGCDYFFKTAEVQKTYAIIVSNGNGGGVFNEGETVTLTAENNGKTFVGWEVNGQIISADSVYSFTCNSNMHITGIYENVVTYYVTVTGGTGTGEYNKGDTVTVTKSENQNTFIGWEVNGQIVSTDASYSFTCTSDITIVAKYEEDGFSKYVKQVTKKQDKDFKIVNLTDIQLHDGESTEITFDIIDKLVKQEKPDMLTFLGDILNDDSTYPSINNVQAVINKIDSYNIPWAPIFGNHDYDTYQTTFTTVKTTTKAQLTAWYEGAKNCLYTTGPSDCDGTSNYVVNVVEENTNKIVESLIFTDSGLSGLTDKHAEFCEDAVKYVKGKNNNTTVSSVLFSHIALPQYGDAITHSKSIEYRDVTGIVGRDPCDLASGSRLVFETIKQLGSTTMCVCGHDHENSYYSDYQGITLAFAMKSSEGDKHTNYSSLGGAVVTIGGTKAEMRYARVVEKFDISGTDSKKGDYAIQPTTLPYWKNSGSTLEFDIELPAAGSLSLNIEGTNITRLQKEEKYRIGAWNRLSVNDKIDASTGSADYGTMTKVNDYYHYKLDLAKIGLNKGSGEIAYGDETARLVYFNNAVGSFKVSNVDFVPGDPVTETNQVDLSSAVITGLSDVYYDSNYQKPVPTVTLGQKTLKQFDDFMVLYENNKEVGTATVTVSPSGKGAHFYKGSKSVTFNILDNVEGHTTAVLVDGSLDTPNPRFNLENWYNSGKSLYFEVKRIADGTQKSGETAKLDLQGRLTANSGEWNRLSIYYYIDFSSRTIRNGDSTQTLCSFVAMDYDWYSVTIPFNSISLNTGEGASGAASEIFRFMYISNVTRSFKLDNLQII